MYFKTRPAWLQYKRGVTKNRDLQNPTNVTKDFLNNARKSTNDPKKYTAFSEGTSSYLLKEVPFSFFMLIRVLVSPWYCHCHWGWGWNFFIFWFNNLGMWCWGDSL